MGTSLFQHGTKGEPKLASHQIRGRGAPQLTQEEEEKTCSCDDGRSDGNELLTIVSSW